ncbi:MAG: hypothetical protein ACE366_31850 [Bradymonadia bacterium]
MRLSLTALALVLPMVTLTGCEEEAAGFGRGTVNLPSTCGAELPCAEGFECLMLPDSDLGFCSCDGAPNCAETPCVCEAPQSRGEGEGCSIDANCAEGLVCAARDAVGTLGCVAR